MQYPITDSQRSILGAKQGGKCAICGEEGFSAYNGRSLSVDHDHSTNEVRGMLCGRCNTGLGMFRDRPSLLRKAIKYLQISRGETDQKLDTVVTTR